MEIAPKHLDDPDVVCMNINRAITGLTFTLVFSVRKTDYSTNNEVDFAVVMLDDEHQRLADEIVLHGKIDDKIEHSITLAARASGLSKLPLVERVKQVNITIKTTLREFIFLAHSFLESQEFPSRNYGIIEHFICLCHGCQVSDYVVHSYHGRVVATGRDKKGRYPKRKSGDPARKRNPQRF